jgi:hypothetical protein
VFERCDGVEENGRDVCFVGGGRRQCMPAAAEGVMLCWVYFFVFVFVFSICFYLKVMLLSHCSVASRSDKV